MTVATQITFVRLLLIPVFVWLGVAYGVEVAHGRDAEAWRHAAVMVFVVAALSDALDGWVARRFNQKSKLGSVLDPIADKGLMLAALLVLSFAGWPIELPVWFTVLVISRDVAIVAASMLLHYLKIDVEVTPILLGKISTASQMSAIAWVMLQIDWISHLIPVGIAGAFTILSWLGYFLCFMKLLKEHGHVR